MHETWTVELFVYLAATLSAVLLLPRCVNWRLRLIVGIIGLQGLAQALSDLKLHHPFWQTRLASTAGIVELFGGALALTAIHLLRRENAARKSTEARLRLSEAAEGVPVFRSALQNGDGTIPPQTAGSGTEPAANADTWPSGPEPPRKLRRDRRFPVSVHATFTMLDGDRQVLVCRVADISQGGASLCLPELVPPGRLVKVEFQHHMYLGEVCWVQEVGELFITGVRFEQTLDLNELSRILREAGYEAREAGVSVLETVANAKSA